MIIWIDVEKALNKTQHDKKNTLTKTKRRELPNQIKSINEKAKCWKSGAFPLQSGAMQGCPPSTLLNISLEVLANTGSH